MVVMMMRDSRWLILSALSATLALSFLDITAVAVILPQIQSQLGASTTALQWVVTSYQLALAIFIILGGRLGDIYGHRQIFLGGAVLFLVASIGCALAQHIHILILFRALQGIAGALLMPNTSTLLLNTFPARERGRATGIYVGSASIFLAFGPLIGGILTFLASWRLIFWINVPLLLWSIAIIYLLISKQKRRHKEIIDKLGFILLALGFCTLIFALSAVVRLGWHSPLLIALFFICLLSFAGFCYWEQQVKTPLVSFSIFKNRTFVGALILIFCLQGVLMATVFMTIWFQIVLRFSPLQAGLAALPTTVPILLISPWAGHLVDRYGFKWPAIAGFILYLLGAIWLIFGVKIQNYVYLLPGLLLVGIGLPLATSPVTMIGLSSVVKNKRGLGAAVIHTARQIGGATGMALLGSLMTSTIAWLWPHNLPQEKAISHVASYLTSIENPIRLSSSQQHIYIMAKQIYTSALSVALIAVAVILLLALINLWTLKNSKITD